MKTQMIKKVMFVIAFAGLAACSDKPVDTRGWTNENLAVEISECIASVPVGLIDDAKLKATCTCVYEDVKSTYSYDDYKRKETVVTDEVMRAGSTFDTCFAKP